MIELGTWSPTPPAALGVFLVTGHVLADFLFQTQGDVEAKHRGDGFVRHGIIVFVTHVTLVVPLWSAAVALAVAGLAVTHGVIDWGKSRYLSSRTGPLTAFALDQAAHLLVVGGVWVALVRLAPPSALPYVDPSTLGVVTTAALFAAAFAFNGTGGSVIVDGILRRLKQEWPEEDEAGGVPGGGRLIGILERTLVLVLLLNQQWAAMAILVTAKSIARFEELKVRRFAEYYLVGTLTSLLVALGVAFFIMEIVFPTLT